MKIQQIKEIIDVILNIPNEDYTSPESCKFKNRILNWEVYHMYSVGNYNHYSYQLNLKTSNLENKDYNYSTIYFNSKDSYDLLIERSKEIKEYLDNKMYNFITKD